MIARIKAFFDVMQRGRELTNAEAWKTRQNVVNILTGFGLAVVAFLRLEGVELPLTNDDIFVIAGGIAVIVGLFNPYITTATTKRIGVSPKHDDTPPAESGHQGSGDGFDFLDV